MLHESWPAAWHKSESFELDALFAEVNNNCSKEGEAECGAEGSGGDAESPPPLPAFGYAHGALSPSHSRSYQELRPAAAHARDMQAYAHLEEVFKPGTPAAPGSTDGVYLRRSSPDLSPSPERRDDFRAHYEPYTPAPAPPAYSHDHHHHVDGGGGGSGGGGVYSRCAYAAGSPYFGNGTEISTQPQIWTSSAGGSPSYGGGGGVVLGEEYAEAGAEGAGGGSLPAFSARFGGAFACATSRPNTVYGTGTLAAPPYSHQEVWNLESSRRPQMSAAASLSANGHEAAGHVVHQLPDHDDVAVAPQLARRDRVQRVRPLLQAAQHQPPARHEEGLYTDSKEKTQKQYKNGTKYKGSSAAHRRVGSEDRELVGERGGRGQRRAVPAGAELLRAARAEGGGAAARACARRACAARALARTHARAHTRARRAVRRGVPARGRRAPGAAHRRVHGQLSRGPPASIESHLFRYVTLLST
ncbi:uncharacterized protein LOC118263184 isoform X13 [Spodoptera frugiperda]|uniref:Uncharacterized protein LOC118263184 isoform X13 n=1 Tax=Spodoptera frugiperda TaxID=7108 RepID=A0A9R0EWH7_SPOFR|nr:uncharacterized protein LOC118263184 isoform X13 [Spodoptera frugiperda]